MRFRVLCLFSLLCLLAPQAQAGPAIQAAASGDWAGARAAAARAGVLEGRVFYWLVCTQKGAQIVWRPADFANLSRFVAQSPGWPRLDEITLMAEKAMPPTLTGAEVVAWFAAHPPRTSAGMARYVDALIAAGDEDRARTVLRAWWGSALLSAQDQKTIYGRYARLLDAGAHVARLDALLFAGYDASARGLADWMGPGYRALADARIAVKRDKGGVDAAIARVPVALLADAGLRYERLRWRRKHDQNAGAIAILADPPPPAQIRNPKDWWTERHIMIRRLTEVGDYRAAYAIARDHGQGAHTVSFAQGEFLAGWLALRFMGDARAAFAHFETLYYGVKTPVSRARAAYWAGRAARDMGHAPVAEAWFKVAADVPMRFYGQLAAAELMANGAPAPDFSSPRVSRGDRARFQKDERYRAAGMLHAAGLDEAAAEFLTAFAQAQGGAAAYAYAAEAATKMGLAHVALSITKQAERQGLAMGDKAWPVLPPSHARRADRSLEPALVHAIIRQESMFNPKVVSHAGARGLMQLMPATARETAGRMGVRYSRGRLTSDPGYNISIGSAYLAQMMKRYGGAAPLAIAAYNAGPGNVDRWLATFGDPRKGEVGVIDWVELIPVYETRNYVQRVLENRQVYRARL